MSANSKIEWCDHTFNPWEGCAKVSPGCAHCYAETRNARWNGGTATNWGRGAPRRRTSAANWRLPLKWNREEDHKRVSHAEFVEKRRPRVFCASLADWLDDEVPIQWLADLLDLIRITPNLDWLLLTKRPQNFDRLGDALIHTEQDTRYWLSAWSAGEPPHNVWIGTTVEDQARADERIPLLLDIPARIRFLSCEPLLGPVNLNLDYEVGAYQSGNHSPLRSSRGRMIHWLICGGESGKDARPMMHGWATSLRDQCKLAGIPFLFKQWGEWGPTAPIPSPMSDMLEPAMQRLGKKVAGRLLDGIGHNAFPK